MNRSIFLEKQNTISFLKKQNWYRYTFSRKGLNYFIPTCIVRFKLNALHALNTKQCRGTGRSRTVGQADSNFFTIFLLFIQFFTKQLTICDDDVYIILNSYISYFDFCQLLGYIAEDRIALLAQTITAAADSRSRHRYLVQEPEPLQKTRLRHIGTMHATQSTSDESLYNHIVLYSVYIHICYSQAYLLKSNTVHCTVQSIVRARQRMFTLSTRKY